MDNTIVIVLCSRSRCILRAEPVRYIGARKANKTILKEEYGNALTSKDLRESYHTRSPLVDRLEDLPLTVPFSHCQTRDPLFYLDPPSTVLCQSQNESLNLSDQVFPEYDLGLDMLSSQDILNLQEIPQATPELAKKDTVDSADMDCEGFQDLRDWCSTQTAGETPAHSIIDKDYQFYYDNSEEKNMAAIQEAEFFWEDIGLCSSASTPNNSVQTQHRQLLTVQGADNLNIVTENVTNAVEINTEDLDLVTFDDLPAYEETIELGPSDENLTVEYVDDPPCHSQDGSKWGLSAENNVQFNTDTCESESSTYGMKSYDSDVMLSLDIRQSLKKSNTTSYENSYSFTSNINETVGREDPPANFESVNFNFALSSNTKHNNDIIIENIILDHSSCQEEPPKLATSTLDAKSSANLKLNFNWENFSVQPSNFIGEISTPDVLMTVEQLENDSKYNFKQFANDHPTISYPTVSETCIKEEDTFTLTPPDTPKWPSRKRRRDSEDSDASYVPPVVSQKRSKKSSASKDIMEIINKPAKRGRPPKHRDSVSSTGTSYTEDHSAASSPGDKYRERRDKNNEASRRSRYNRKMKDSEMVTYADDLESRNSELRIKVTRLERQKQILREILLKSVSTKQT